MAVTGAPVLLVLQSFIDMTTGWWWLGATGPVQDRRDRQNSPDNYQQLYRSIVPPDPVREGKVHSRDYID